MFDTMTITKVGGAFCGALLVFLLIKWGGDVIYSTETGGHGDHAEAAYLIEIDEPEDSHGDEEVAMVDVVALVAAGDVAKGTKVFSKCKACHKLDEGVHSTGPSLFAIVGADIAGAAGFGYSGALTGLEGTWTAQALFDFLTKPSAYAPGTKMSFAGLKKEKDRANLIAYLQTIGN